MPLTSAIARIGRSLNPQIDLQVVGSGLSSSFDRYVLTFTVLMVSAPLAAGLITYLLLREYGYTTVVALVTGVGVAFILLILLVAAYISLPSLAARSRADRLERRFLLLATTLAAMVYSGGGLGEAFLSLGRRVPRELNDFRLELEYIASLIAIGRPLHEALEAAARITPSPSLRSLLMGLSAASRTGTGVEEVIEASITEYLGVRETEIDRVTNSLGALLEFYMAIAVMLPIGIGAVGLLLLFYHPPKLSFNLLLAITTFVLVPFSVISVILLAESLVSKLKG